MDVESLLRTRVITPLGLHSTAITAPPQLKAKLAVGHNAVLQPAPSFEAISIYAARGPAIGGLVSTADDLLTVLAVAMGYERSPLAASMTAMLSTRRPIAEGTDQALGWMVPEEHESLTVDSTDEAERVHALLAEGGQIFMKMEGTFFAFRFCDAQGQIRHLLDDPPRTSQAVDGPSQGARPPVADRKAVGTRGMTRHRG